jgi:hypothetical protein
MESNGNFDEEKTEFVIYEERTKDEEERIENSCSDIEMISDEEYLLECARYGDFDELKNLMQEAKDLDVNYKDSKSNSAIRKFLSNNSNSIRYVSRKWPFGYC